MNGVTVETMNKPNWSGPAIGLLAVFWALCIGIVIASSFFQREFFNPEIMVPFFAVVATSELIYSLLILFFDRWKNKQSIWWILYSVNSVLITTIMVKVHWNQSMFFMLYLVNIVSAGLTLKSRGSYIISLLSLIGFNFAVVVSPQVKLLSYIFTLVINNSALVLVSYLSGQLNDYLDNLGLKLDVVSRDLRKMKNLHELILSYIPSGVLTVDSSGELVQGNEKVRQILSEGVFSHSEEWVRFRRELEASSLNATGQREFLWKSNEEKKLILRCQKASANFENSDEAADIYVIEDVTQIREIEEDLKNKEKLAAIGSLAAGIAHEIRNPLASISGSVQLLSAQAGNEEDKKLFNIVIRETDRLNILIGEFLDYAKPLPRPTDRISLTAIITEVLELVSYNKKLRPDVIQEHVVDPSEIFILGYKDKLKQAFLNIIINAYQAMEKVEKPHLRIQVGRDQGWAVLKFRDSGCGMKEETRRRIFEPFYTTKSQGTGLGLAVTHKIFEGHGASIMVESEVGLGTEFVIKIKEADRLI